MPMNKIEEIQNTIREKETQKNSRESRFNRLYRQYSRLNNKKQKEDRIPENSTNTAYESERGLFPTVSHSA